MLNKDNEGRLKRLHNAFSNVINMAENGARSPAAWQDPAWRSAYYGYYNAVYDGISDVMDELDTLQQKEDFRPDYSAREQYYHE
jgi:hypothetical protein